MKVIVAGGRDFTNATLMHIEITQLVLDGWLDEHSTLVCGIARGADITAYKLWSEVYDNPIAQFPADWDRFGKSAGYRRNIDMANAADKLIAFWDGKSRGTQHMIETMSRLGKPVHIQRY